MALPFGQGRRFPRDPTSASFQETPDRCFCLLSISGLDLLDVVWFTYSSSSFGLEGRIGKRHGLTEAGQCAHRLPACGGGLHGNVNCAEPHQMTGTPSRSKPHLLRAFSTHQEEEHNKGQSQRPSAPKQGDSGAFVMWASTARQSLGAILGRAFHGLCEYENPSQIHFPTGLSSSSLSSRVT